MPINSSHDITETPLISY